MAAATAKSFFCKIQPQIVIAQKKEFAIQKFKSPDSSPVDNNRVNILLQPRVGNLRQYGSDPVGVARKRSSGEVHDDGVSFFYASLLEYLDNSRKTQDFEVISGRFAMVVFAATIASEIVTGSSVFRKMDFEEITKVVGMCLGAIICSAGFAWFSSARTKVGRIFTISCNTFIDSLIDNIVDGLFYDNDLWTDEM